MSLQHSAYLCEMLSIADSYLITGDVYRRDTIDQCHSPVFHQIDGAKMCPNV